MSKVRGALVVAVGAMLLLLLLDVTGLLERLELITLDLRYQAGIGRSAPKNPIVLAWIDQESMDYLQHLGQPFPWPRSLYQQVAEYVLGGGAKAIIFDVLFDQSVDAKDDRAAGEALAKTRRDVLAFKFMTRAVDRTPDEMARFKARAVDVEGPLPRRGLEQGFLLPIPELEQAAARIGFVNITPDADKVYRGYDLLRLWAPAPDAAPATYPSLAVAAAMVHTGAKAVTRDVAGDLGLHGEVETVLAGEDARMLLNFRGPELTFEHVKFVNIFESINLTEDKKTPLYPASRFRDKTIIVGINAEGYEDIFPTPLSKVFPGMELHATALDNLLSGDALWAPRGGLWLGAGGIAAATVAVLLLPGVVVPSLTLLLLLLAFLAATMVCWTHLLVLPVAAPVLGGVAGTGGAFVWRLVVEGRQRRQLKRAFSSYLAPEVMAQVLRNPDVVALGGETREVTLFFTDLAGFTGLAEHAGPQALVAFLNEYFTRMCEPILREHGVIDKFIGDAIMALFGAPLAAPDHGARAVRAALVARQVSETIASELHAAGKPPVETRIGIHSGTAVVGNMGSQSRFDYTAIGDTVNLASRLEGANKAFGTGCLVSETTWSQVGDAVLGREVGLVAVKGRHAPIRVFEPLALAAEAGATARARAKEHAEALALLRSGDRQGALAAFRSMATRAPGDRLVQVYIERLQDLAWDGVFRLDAK